MSTRIEIGRTSHRPQYASGFGLRPRVTRCSVPGKVAGVPIESLRCLCLESRKTTPMSPIVRDLIVELLAVIGCEDDHRVLQRAASLESVEQRPECFVDEVECVSIPIQGGQRIEFFGERHVVDSRDPGRLKQRASRRSLSRGVLRDLRQVHARPALRSGLPRPACGRCRSPWWRHCASDC